MHPLSYLIISADIKIIERDGTYSNLNINSLLENRAKYYLELNKASTTIVAICSKRKENTITDLVSCWNLGIIPVIFPNSVTSYEIDFYRDRLPISAIIYDDNVETFICGKYKLNGKSGSTYEYPVVGLLTSGSTGKPKIVIHSFRSILSRIALNISYLTAESFQNTLVTLPLSFGHGLIGNFLTPLYVNSNVYILRDTSPAIISNIHKYINEKKITFFSSVPSTWQMIMQLSDQPEKALKLVTIGSSTLSKSLWKKAIDWARTDNVVNAYGITEMANWISGASAMIYTPETGLVGKPWGGKAAIINSDREILFSGEGEIVLLSPCKYMDIIMDNYSDNSVKGSNFWFPTGDIGTIDTKGVIRLSGRKNNMFKRLGIRLFPEEIEEILKVSDSITECVIVPVGNSLTDNEIEAVIVPSQPELFNIDSFKNWAKNTINRSKLPSKWMVVEEIPKNSNGKVDRTKTKMLLSS